MSATEFPSFNEELGRKAITVVGDLTAKNAAGEITDREFRIAVGAVYDSISGLVPWEEADVISAVFNHLVGVENVTRS